METDRVATIADGMATRMTYDLTLSILKSQLDEVVTLDEDELKDAVRAALQLTHNLAEPAGAAPLAAARRTAHELAGRKVVCVMTGGNIDMTTLRMVLS